MASVLDEFQSSILLCDCFRVCLDLLRVVIVDRFAEGGLESAIQIIHDRQDRDRVRKESVDDDATVYH